MAEEESDENQRHNTDGNYFQSYAHDPYLRGNREPRMAFPGTSLDGWLSLRMHKHIKSFLNILRD